MTFTDLDLLLIVLVLFALILIGAVITIGNERVRRATLGLRDVARDFALADLAARRAQMARVITCGDVQAALAALNQIAYDAAGRRLDLVQLDGLSDAQVLAIHATSGEGNPVVFTPSADTYLRTPAVKEKRIRQWRVQVHSISPLRLDAFVIEELNAVAQFLARQRGVQVMLPRTEKWDFVVLPQPPAPIAAKKAKPPKRVAAPVAK